MGFDPLDPLGLGKDVGGVINALWGSGPPGRPSAASEAAHDAKGAAWPEPKGGADPKEEPPKGKGKGKGKGDTKPPAQEPDPWTQLAQSLVGQLQQEQAPMEAAISGGPDPTGGGHGPGDRRPGGGDLAVELHRRVAPAAGIQGRHGDGSAPAGPVGLRVGLRGQQRRGGPGAGQHGQGQRRRGEHRPRSTLPERPRQSPRRGRVGLHHPARPGRQPVAGAQAGVDGRRMAGGLLQELQRGQRSRAPPDPGGGPAERHHPVQRHQRHGVRGVAPQAAGRGIHQRLEPGHGLGPAEQHQAQHPRARLPVRPRAAPGGRGSDVPGREGPGHQGGQQPERRHPGPRRPPRPGLVPGQLGQRPAQHLHRAGPEPPDPQPVQDGGVGPAPSLELAGPHRGRVQGDPLREPERHPQGLRPGLQAGGHLGDTRPGSLRHRRAPPRHRRHRPS